MTREEREARNREIVKMRHAGKSMSEIAEVCGLKLGGVRYVCQCYGVAGVMSDRKGGAPKKPRNQYTNGMFDREANVIRCISERAPGFEYAGNFTGTDGFADVKCKVCGTVVRKSFVSIRHGKATCAECARREREASNEAKRIAHEKDKAEKKKLRINEKLLSMPSKQETMRVCLCCGSLFIPAGENHKFCSQACADRTRYSIKKDRRLRKMRAVVVDKDITIERLYRRDKGRCYICGQTCDWNDCYIREDGTFIAFDKYPSIEHVVPLSKGGLHAWENVKLACRRCNSLKGDQIHTPRVPS